MDQRRDDGASALDVRKGDAQRIPFPVGPPGFEPGTSEL